MSRQKTEKYLNERDLEAFGEKELKTVPRETSLCDSTKQPQAGETRTFLRPTMKRLVSCGFSESFGKRSFFSLFETD